MSILTQRRTISRPNQTRVRHQRAGLLFVLLCVLFTVVFFLVPLGMTAWMSPHNWGLLKKPYFTGLENCANLFSDTTFWTSLLFTSNSTTPAIFLVAFGLALLVQRPLRWVGTFRTAYFLPVVIGLGTSSLLWT